MLKNIGGGVVFIYFLEINYLNSIFVIKEKKMRAFLIYYFLLISTYSFSQNILKDIYPGKNSSNPSYLTEYSGIAYFIGEDSLHGNELWRTDGSFGGTYMVKDIKIGKGSSNIKKITLYDSIIYFIADDSIHGEELWRSNGTSVGTYLIKEIIAGNVINPIADDALIGFNGFIYFTATDGVNGKELWRSDGTELGTKLFWDKYPNNVGSRPTNFQVYKNKLFFYSFDSLYGREIWYTDGTDTGTKLLKDINLGIANSESNTQFIICNNLLFFIAEDGINGNELWSTDGTQTGTKLIKDIRPGINSSWITFNYSLDSIILFLADDSTHGREIWLSDGSLNGTHLLKDCVPGMKGQNDIEIQKFKNELYVTLNNETVGAELWRFSLDLTSFKLIKDINSGSMGSKIKHLTVADSQLFFIANDGSNGPELWVTNGLNAILMKDIYIGNKSDFEPNYLTYLGDGILCFSAYNTEYGNELWSLNNNLYIKIIKQGFNINVYPNPANNEIKIVKNDSRLQDVTFWICNAIGEKMLEIDNDFESTLIVNIKFLNSGLYILNCSDKANNIIYQFKFIKN